MAVFVPNPSVVRQILADDEVQRSIEEVAEEGLKFAQQHVAVDTGELYDSLHIEDGDTPGSKRVVAGTDHWLYEEFGTSDSTGQPFLRPMIPALGLKPQ